MSLEENWMQAVDGKLDGIAQSLETLIRVEEKQTALIASHNNLENSVKAAWTHIDDFKLTRAKVEDIEGDIKEIKDGLGTLVTEKEQKAGLRNGLKNGLAWAVGAAGILSAILAYSSGG